MSRTFLTLPALVRRERASLAANLLAPPIALIVTVILNLGLYVVMGRDPVAVVYAMLIEPFVSWASFSEVLLKTGPLLLIAKGLAIGFRAKVFNIGAEGQFVLGAIFASAIPIWWPEATGQWIWPAMLLLGTIGGAFWASLTAFWRVRLNANEILVSLMLSFVAVQLLNYLLLGPWKDPNGFNFPQSVMFQYDAMIPILIEGTRVNVSLILALL
ncbi:ABC transporter permease, partial [Rhizobium phaseoli]